MRLVAALALALALAGTITAAPAPQTTDPVCEPWGCETATVTEFNLFRNETTPQVLSVSFKLAAEGLTAGPIDCAKTDPVLGQDIVRCSGTNYFFELSQDQGGTYFVEILHQISVGRGRIGTSNVPIICRASGAGRMLCSQPAGASTSIVLAPPPGSTE